MREPELDLSEVAKNADGIGFDNTQTACRFLHLLGFTQDKHTPYRFRQEPYLEALIVQGRKCCVTVVIGFSFRPTP
jgi:hypothetical protein